MIAVVFDLDGTLVDTLADIGHAMNAALAALGQPGHPFEAYRGFIGEGVRRLAERALPPGRGDLVDAATAEFRRVYGEHLLDRTRPYPGVPELLDGLVAAGVPLAVLSNKPDPATRRIVESLFARWPFAEIGGERPGVPRKPDPAAALAIADALGVAPARCLFVGDSGIDVATARAAGMVAVGAGWGFRGADELRAAGADVVLGAPPELLPLLARYGA